VFIEDLTTYNYDGYLISWSTISDYLRVVLLMYFRRYVG